MLTILGPTASGKTRLAVGVASRLGAEIISGDSRQVYRGMDLGTGKDLRDYVCDGRRVPVHLVNVADAGTKYTLFHFQQDFHDAYADIVGRGCEVVFCGGSGLYVESVLRSYHLSPVPANPELRARLEGRSLQELTELLSSYKTLHNTTDVDTAQRAIRAIEIADYDLQHPVDKRAFPEIHGMVFGIDIPRELRRERITRRLHARIGEGMVREVRLLLKGGLQPEDLLYYGLEYRYLTLYVEGQMSFAEMVNRLEIAIHQFAKRQMTWFRGMERRGVSIHWLDGRKRVDELVKEILSFL